MPATQQHRALSITTPLGEDVLLLRRLSAVEALGRLFEFDLEMASVKADVDFNRILGQPVSIRHELPDGGVRHFHGIVSRFAHAGGAGRICHYRATVVPWLWLLTRTSDCRIFQELTVPEILKQVFGIHGFADFREDLSASYKKWEYCVQYRETDFNFVSRLMEQEGIYYYFEHDEGRHVLVLSDSINAHRPQPGFETVAFLADDSAGVRGGMHEWRCEQRLEPGAYVLNAFDFKDPKKKLQATLRQPASHAWGELALYDAPAEYEQSAVGQHYASVRLEEAQTEQHVFSGRASSPGIGAGWTFKLTDFSVAALNQEYLITRAVINVVSDEFSSSAGSQDKDDCCHVQLAAIEARRPFRAACLTPKPVVQGPQTAIVVGKPGEEIWTDTYGRIKVRFHWDRQSKGDEKSSCWIRVAQNWAGKKWGTFFLPRIGQEVIVEFLEGDPDQPIVTGCVYNGDAPTPYELPTYATKSTLRTNSSKGGNGYNELRFEDKKGEEQVFIHGQRDLDVRVRNDVRETNYGHRDVRVGWEKDGAKGGNLNVLVRQDANARVEGGQYERVEGARHHSVGGDVVEQFRKNQSTFVQDSLTLNATEIILEGASAIHHKAGKVAVEGVRAVHIKGATVAIEGSTAVSLKVGGNFVSVTAAGVAINGTMVMVNSGGSSLSAEAAKGAASASLQPPCEARQADLGKAGDPLPDAPAKPAAQTLQPQRAS